MNRPHAYIMNDCKIRFPKAPFAHKPLVMVIPTLTFPIPLRSGNVAYLKLPANYSNSDLDIITTVFNIHIKYLEEEKKSPLQLFINRNKKKQTIVSKHY